MLPHAPTLLPWGQVSLGQLAERARNPLLRRLWMHAFVSEMAAVSTALTVAWMHKKCAGYPRGGSRPFAEKVAASFLAARGALRDGARVSKIPTNNGRAMRVILAEGEEHQAGIVISAADAYMTLFEFLGGDFNDSRITKLFQQFTPLPTSWWHWASPAPLPTPPQLNALAVRAPYPARSRHGGGRSARAHFHL